MKKLLLVLALVAFTSSTFVSCTPEDKTENEYQTDKDKVCPPHDRNCNGIPDDQE